MDNLRQELITVLLCFFVFPVFAETAAAPIPQIDSGGHSGGIRQIVFSSDGRYLVSASEDKTIRIWDVRQQKTVRTIRGLIGPGHEGKFYAVAISSDNKYLAVAGWLESEGRKYTPCCGDIRLIEFASGKQVAVLRGHESTVLDLKFSADNRLLASGSADNSAIIWEVESRLRKHVLGDHEGDVSSVAFSQDGERLVTASWDNRVMLWEVASGRRLKTLQGHTDRVQAVVFTPNNRILSAGWDRSVRAWDGYSGESIGTLVKDHGSRIASLSIGTDGRLFLAGSGMGNSCPYNSLVLYEADDGRHFQTYSGEISCSLATAISPDNKWAAAEGTNAKEIHIWSIDSGKIIYRLRGQGRTVWSVGFSSDGNKIAWGKTDKSSWAINDYGPLQYQLRLPDANTPLGQPQPVEDTGQFVKERSQYRDWKVSHRRGGSYGYNSAVMEIRNGDLVTGTVELDETSGFYHNAYTIAPDGEHIVSGAANGQLRLYDLYGVEVGRFTGHRGNVWSVAVSPDNRYLVSGSSDQTVRVWSMETQELLFSLFHGDDGEWVAWTPQGYYTSSAEGDAMVGWHINLGSDKSADYVRAAQLKKHFYRPDIIDSSVHLGSAIEAIARSDDTDFALPELLDSQPPQFRITEVKRSSSPGLLDVTLKFSDDRQSVSSLEIYVDGRQIRLRGGVRRRLSSDGWITVQVSEGQQMILAANNATGRTTQQQDISHLQTSQPHRPGKLYLLSVGVDAYPELNNPLEFAGKDASELRKVLQAKASRRFTELVPVVMTDEEGLEPTAGNIERKLKEMAGEMTEHDTLIMFLAGHGESSGQDYLFLAADARKHGGSWVDKTVLKWSQLLEPLKQAAGKRILLLDTCHAGNAFNPRLIKDAYDEQIAILTATDGPYSAQEMTSLGHGVFTHSLLQGLRGRADSRNHPDNSVSLFELSVFVREEVMHLTRNQQRPDSAIPRGVEYILADL